MIKQENWIYIFLGINLFSGNFLMWYSNIELWTTLVGLFPWGVGMLYLIIRDLN